MIPSGIRFLIDGGHQAPSPDNSQPWCFTWDGEALTLSYKSDGPVAAVFGDDSHGEKLTMGAVIENIVQLADAAGMDGNWDFEQAGRRYLRFTPARSSEEIEGDRQHAVFTRHTNRFTFSPDPISAKTVAGLETLEEQGCRAAVIDSPPEVSQLADWIRRASAMRFRNRRLHEWFGQTLRFTPAEVDRGDGLDVATIELPPGGTGLLKLIMDWRRMERLNRIGMYRLLSGIESQAIKKSPALIAIMGPPDASLAAGRLMERTWLEAERQGLAAQPFYVLPDQLVRLREGDLPADLSEEGRQLQRDFAAVYGEQAFPHMLFRVG